MPKNPKSTQPSEEPDGDTGQRPVSLSALLKPDRSAGQARGEGHVNAVSRALSVLTAFRAGEIYLSLAEISRRTEMHKPTVLRLARTLAASRFLVRRGDGAWRLGPAAGLVGAFYQAQFDLDFAIEPILRELSAATGESASFYVYEGNLRSCLMRCDGPAAIPDHIRSGEVLPLNRGAPGRVILAALGLPGVPYEKIRRMGFHVTHGERVAGVASIAAAVRGEHGAVLGAVSTSGPVGRFTEERLPGHAEATVAAAKKLGICLGAMPATALRGTWHP